MKGIPMMPNIKQKNLPLKVTVAKFPYPGNLFKIDLFPQLLRTYGSEDCEGKEATLDVVPVVCEVLRDNVYSGILGITAHFLVLRQGIRHLLQHKQVCQILVEGEGGPQKAQFGS